MKDYGYVGKGYYGSCSEYPMMEEIYKNGPIIIAFNASPDLYYYSSGVFITNSKINQNSFEFTNHAVVCVGWGQTIHEGHILKYWILKNSWGEKWGESGYFKFLRGINLSAIENQAIYLEPLLNSQ